MKTTRLDLPVMASWMESNQRRLDGNPYLSGAFEAKVILERLPKKNRQHLQDVTEGGIKGLVNAGRIARTWVNDPDYGVPFLSSTDILQADLSNVSLISKKAVKLNPKLTIREEWILITRSGSIGRMAYCRSNMDGMACTEDVLRVIPDRTKIPPGYLYAYLSSKFGVPLVVSGTYGAIIQHIEPHHIADLPVPRLGNAIEEKIHNLITSAAAKRSEASQKQKNAIQIFYKTFNLSPISDKYKPTGFATSSVNASDLSRLDATHYSANSLPAAEELKTCSDLKKTLGEVARVFTPGIFKRIYAGEPSYGYPYFSGSELFQIHPEPRGYLSKKAPGIEDYLVKKDWLLIQDAGQVGGLIGRLVRVGPYADNSVVSNHLMRVVSETREDSAYLFAVLSSSHGYRAIVRNAFGSSIPQLDPAHISRVVIPWTDQKTRKLIAQSVLEAWDLFDQADIEEQSAIEIVNNEIERGASSSL
jgi:type I restriction enzyme, S subunit